MTGLTLRRNTLLLLVVVPALVLGVYLLVAGLYLDSRVLPSPLINRPMPALDLPSLAPSADSVDKPEPGFDIHELKGKVWVMNVWASWCRPCTEEHPTLLELQSRQQVVLVGLNYKDNPTQARQWLSQHGNPFDYILSDQDGRAGIALGLYGVPETYLIDRDGIIRDKVVGALTPELLNTRLQSQIEKL